MGSTIVFAGTIGSVLLSRPDPAAAPAALAAAEDCSTTYDVSPERCNSYRKTVLEGADVVAYFTAGVNGTRTAGTSDFQSTFDGYTFYFASAENLATFEAAPATYAP